MGQKILSFTLRQLNKAFEWGKTDCASIVYFYLLKDRAIKIKEPNYTDLKGAIKAYKETGGLENVLVEEGFSKLPLSVAQKGDVLISTFPQEHNLPCYGVMTSRDRYITSSEKTGVIIDSILGTKGVSFVMRHG